MVIHDSRKTNLAMCWIDYKKAFDSVPHGWILSVQGVTHYNSIFKKSIVTWRTTLKAGQCHLPPAILYSPSLIKLFASMRKAWLFI